MPQINSDIAQALLKLLEAIDANNDNDSRDWIDVVCTARENLPTGTEQALRECIKATENDETTGKPEMTLEQAKELVFKEGFEVVKDTESDYYRWRARSWVEDSGLYDTEEEAYFGCVELKGLDTSED